MNENTIKIWKDLLFIFNLYESRTLRNLIPRTNRPYTERKGSTCILEVLISNTNKFLTHVKRVNSLDDSYSKSKRTLTHELGKREINKERHMSSFFI